MQEKSLVGHHSLSNTLKLLNKAFVVIDKKSPKEKKQFAKRFSELAVTDYKKAWNHLEKQTDEWQEEALDMLSPITLFQRYQLSPYIGKKDHGVMFCKDIVIGLKLDLGNGDNISYRLDFAHDEDPTKNKLLHLNVELYHAKEKYPICVLLNFSTGRFGFSLKDKQDCMENENKLHALLEITKVKFWLKMTMGHTLVTRMRQPANPQPPHGDIPAEQLMLFVTGDNKYDFDIIKEYLCSLLPKDTGKLRVRGCQDELSLLRCLIEKSHIRAQALQSIFIKIAEKDETHRLLPGLEYLYDIDLADSEQRIHSDQAPAF